MLWFKLLIVAAVVVAVVFIQDLAAIFLVVVLLVLLAGKGIRNLSLGLLISKYSFSLRIEITELALFGRPIKCAYRYDKKNDSQKNNRDQISVSFSIHTVTSQTLSRLCRMPLRL